MTPLGKISVRALGCRKYKTKVFNFYEDLTYINMEITDSDFPTLINYEVIDSYKEIKDDLKKFLWAGYLLEFLNKVEPDNFRQRAFDYLLKTLSIMKVSNKYQLLCMILKLKFTYLFGINPYFKECVICKGKPSFISIKEGGAVCDNHKTVDSYNYNLIKNLYYCDIDKDLNDFKDIDLNYILNFIESYYKYHIQLEQKSLNTIIF